MILENFPKVLWINLDRSIGRRKYMKDTLELFGLDNLRITAVDGKNKKKLEEICIPNNNFTPEENACTCSHINAINYFINNTTLNEIIIFEDDVSFEFLNYIPYNWPRFRENIPESFDVIQLAITTYKKSVNNFLIKTLPEMNYYCSTAYLLSRKGGKKILDKYLSNEIIILEGKLHCTADSIITNIGDTYSIPIFTYLINKSTIHDNNTFLHIQSKVQQYMMWKRWSKSSTYNLEEYFAKFEG